MATATQNKGTNTDEQVSELFQSMQVEDKINVPLRGRGTDPDVIKIREELETMLKDKTARSFQNVAADRREFYARKIRAAATLKGHDEIKVTTRYDKATSKLIWGPDSVLKALAAK